LKALPQLARRQQQELASLLWLLPLVWQALPPQVQRQRVAALQWLLPVLAALLWLLPVRALPQQVQQLAEQARRLSSQRRCR